MVDKLDGQEGQYVGGAPVSLKITSYSSQMAVVELGLVQEIYEAGFLLGVE